MTSFVCVYCVCCRCNRCYRHSILTTQFTSGILILYLFYLVASIPVLSYQAAAITYGTDRTPWYLYMRIGISNNRPPASTATTF